jgi:hypothetical protein
MKSLLLIALSFCLASCSNGESMNRGYVISKSQLEPEKEEPRAEEPDLN